MSTWKGVVRSFGSCNEMFGLWKKGHYAVGSDNQQALEEYMADKYSLPTLLTNRGLAAIHTVIDAFTEEPGMVLCSEDIYPGTRLLLEEMAYRGPLCLIMCDTCRLSDYEVIETLVQEDELVFVETIGNSVEMPVLDWRSVHNSVKGQGGKLVVDSTLMPGWKPWDCADDADQQTIIVGSLTKYEQPYDVWMGGRISAHPANIEEMKSSMLYQSVAMLPPVAKYYLDTIGGMQSRYEQHCRYAVDIAEICHKHPAVKAVHYPGHVSHPHHDLIRQQYGGRAGGLLYIDLAANHIAEQLCDELAGAAANWEIASSFGSSWWRVLPLTRDPLLGFAERDGVVRIATGRENPRENLKVFKEVLDELPTL